MLEKGAFVIPEEKKDLFLRTLIKDIRVRPSRHSSTNAVNILKPVIHLNDFSWLDSYFTEKLRVSITKINSLVIV